MSQPVAPQYHAVISPMLLACLRERDTPPPVVTPDVSRPTVEAARGVHVLRRDGARPVRFEGTFVASGCGTVVTRGETAYTHRLDLYFDANSALVAHIILEPEDEDAARPVYQVVEVHDIDDAERVAAATGVRPTGTTTDPAPHHNSTLSEGNSHVLSNAVA